MASQYCHDFWHTSLKLSIQQKKLDNYVSIMVYNLNSTVTILS